MIMLVREGVEGEGKGDTYGLGVRIPWADEEAVEGLVDPYFPLVVEPEAVCPNPDHAPSIQEDNADCHGVEHRLSWELEALLDIPEGENSDCLGCYADDEEVC